MNELESRANEANELPDQQARIDAPDHFQGPYRERSALGGHTGEWVFRCSFCVVEVPTSNWRNCTHKADCKHATADKEPADA